ncbi:MAG: hypothetical protein IPN71_07400 [Fibrobacteres bacterium]|nr:hypothetical protein [Fibrobacterota bacterium]
MNTGKTGFRAALALAGLSVAGVPVTFKPGDLIKAAEVNANFATLDTAVANAVERLTVQLQALQAKVKADSVVLSGRPGAILPSGVPLGTVIASLKRPDEQGVFMDGDTTWALANGKLPMGVAYKGVFPDLRGQFLRGMNEGRTDSLKDPEIGRLVGAGQGDAFQGHWHSKSQGRTGAGTGGTTLVDWSAGATNAMASEQIGSPESDRINGAPRTSSETRPKNVSVYWYVKVR